MNILKWKQSQELRHKAAVAAGITGSVSVQPKATSNELLCGHRPVGEYLNDPRARL